MEIIKVGRVVFALDWRLLGVRTHLTSPHPANPNQPSCKLAESESTDNLFPSP